MCSSPLSPLGKSCSTLGLRKVAGNMFAHSKFPKTTQQCPRRQPFLVKNQGQALFFYFLHCVCAGSSMLRAGSLWLQRAGATLRGTWASRWAGFSCCRAWALGSTYLLLCRMWNLLRWRIEPVFPALAGRRLSTGPPREVQGKVLSHCFSINNVFSEASIQGSVFNRYPKITSNP